MSVCIIGTVALDSIETPVGNYERILGGSATFAGTAASIFTKTHLVSIVGKDFPKEHLEFLKARNINVDGIKISEGKTFHWQGFYKTDMNQAFTKSTELNVLLEFDPIIPEDAKDAQFVFCANLDPILQRKAIQQFRNPTLVVLDTMNFWIESAVEELKKTLTYVDVFIINDQEIRQLTGIDNIIQAMPEVIKMGPKRLIVKKGEHGSIMFNGSSYFICPAFPLKTLKDPTGAGDSYAGGFIGSLAAAKELNENAFKKSVIYGTLVSSYTVQDFSLGALKALSQKTIQEKFLELKEFVSIPDKI